MLRKDDHPGRKPSVNSIPFPQDVSERPQSFVFAKRAAAADGAGGSSAAAGSVLARTAAHRAQARVCPLRLPAAFRKNGEKILAGIKHAPKNSAKSTLLLGRILLKG